MIIIRFIISIILIMIIIIIKSSLRFSILAFDALGEERSSHQVTSARIGAESSH